MREKSTQQVENGAHYQEVVVKEQKEKAKATEKGLYIHLDAIMEE